ncbi:MAG: nucleotide exchange factor GrpE [Elusimicrobiaceae bacterium]
MKHKDKETPKQETENSAQETAAPQEQTGAKETQPDYYDQLLRLKAEFDNYRKRVEREKPELINWGKRETLMSLLPIYDVMLHAKCQLDKIMAGEKTEQEIKDLCLGIDMIFKEFEKVFASQNVRPMLCVGEPYDPMKHEVLSVVPGDGTNDGLVVSEMQKGFICGDKILRPARVCIAKAPAQAEEKAAE